MFEQNSIKKNEVTLTSKSTYASIFGNYENRPLFSTICEQENCKMFQEKFRSIFEAGRQHGLSSGETMNLVYHATKGKYLDEIPFEDLNDILRYVELNAEYAINLSSPVLYGFLKHLGYFKIKPSLMATKEEIGIAMNTIGKLLSEKAEWKEYYQLAKKLMENCF